VQKITKSLMKAGHILVARIRRIIQWITCTEGLDGSNHLRNFVPMGRLAAVAMNRTGYYRISLVATPALMSASDMISLARVGIPANAFRTKLRYLKQRENTKLQNSAVLTDRSHSSRPHPSSPLLESQLKNVHEWKLATCRLPVRLLAFPTLAR
jgi:hypothetical protein